MIKSESPVYDGPNNEYAPLPAQMLLKSLMPAFSELVGRELLPSYALWRIYEHDAQLFRHRDRTACEVSVSIPIAAEPDTPWPIGVADLHGEEHLVALPMGSALVYQGIAVPHWREAFEGQFNYQLLLHYVVADGPFAGRAYGDGQLR